MSAAVLAALRIRTQNWIETVQTSVKRKGYSVKRHRTRIDVWSAEHRIDSGYFADGWQLRRLWLGSRGNAVGICPHRFYFSTDRSIDRRPEREIVDRSQLPKTSLEKRLWALKQFLDDLREGCGADSNALVRLDISDTDLLGGVTLHGTRQAFPADTKPYNVHKRGGFFDSPDKLKVLLLGEEWQLPKHPTVAWLPEVVGGSLGFLVSLPQSAKNEFDGVMKIWMRDEWDGMNIGREHLARILAAQTLTPGLGLHPRRLPASIYWADGIAAASDDDLRFRGQSVTILD